MRVELHAHAHAGSPAELEFVFSDARTGAPVTDLQPYLSAAGHVIVADERLHTITHGHGDIEDPNGNELWPLPGIRFGPEVGYHHTFAAPGLYKLWGQFRTSAGEVVTADFVVHVELAAKSNKRKWSKSMTTTTHGWADDRRPRLRPGGALPARAQGSGRAGQSCGTQPAAAA